MSIKAYEPSIKIALVHDNSAIASLSPAELKLFDILTVADPADYTIDGAKQYQRMKLCVHKYSPFENSLYIDVDTLWFPKKKISDLLSNLLPYEFYIGKNGEYNQATRERTGINYTYWGEPLKIVRYFKLTNIMPQTISGVFWFKKSEFCDRMFARALQVYNDKNAPTQKWANGKADEYCFNVALCAENYQQPNVHFVYFDKTNGKMSRDTMYANYWGVAAGGNKLSADVRDLYNDLVELYHPAFKFDTVRKHIDKASVIKERNRY